MTIVTLKNWHSFDVNVDVYNKYQKTIHIMLKSHNLDSQDFLFFIDMFDNMNEDQIREVENIYIKDVEEMEKIELTYQKSLKEASLSFNK